MLLFFFTYLLFLSGDSKELLLESFSLLFNSTECTKIWLKFQSIQDKMKQCPCNEPHYCHLILNKSDLGIIIIANLTLACLALS